MTVNINLLPPKVKKADNGKKFFTAVATTVTLTLAIMTYNTVSYSKDAQNLANKRFALEAELAELTGTNNANESEEMESPFEGIEYLETLVYKVTPIIKETDKHLGENDYITSYAFNSNGVELIVDFETKSSVAKYSRLVKASNYFSNSRLLSISKKEVGPKQLNTFKDVSRHTAAISLNLDKKYLLVGSDAK